MDRRITYPDPVDKRYVAVMVPKAGNTVTISFVAPCTENNDASLGFYELDDRTGRFRLAGSTRTSAPAVAGRVDPGAGDAVAFLAHYEGMKLGKLVGAIGVGPAPAPVAPVERPVVPADSDIDTAATGGCGCGCGCG